MIQNYYLTSGIMLTAHKKVDKLSGRSLFAAIGPAIDEISKKMANRINIVESI